MTALAVSGFAFCIIYLLEHFQHDAETTAVADMKEGNVDAGLAVEDTMKAIGQLILSIGKNFFTRSSPMRSFSCVLIQKFSIDDFPEVSLRQVS